MLQEPRWLPRAEGSVRLRLGRGACGSKLDVLHQAGAARVRFPRCAANAPLEAVLINTAGGLTGGDRFDIDVGLAAGVEATVTTAAAEKIYRARDTQAAVVAITLGLAAGASLAWLPQPTIVYNDARLDRRTEVELAGEGRLLALEMLIFGRAAMGEVLEGGRLNDAWRVRRAGVLLFAESLRLEGAIAEHLDRPAVAAGARAAALLLYVAADAASRLAEVRVRLEAGPLCAGASSWNGMLVVRALAADGAALQKHMGPLVEWLSARALPRLWRC